MVMFVYVDLFACVSCVNVTDETGSSSNAAAVEEENAEDDDGSDNDDDVEFTEESIGELMNAFDKMGTNFSVQKAALVSNSCLHWRFAFVLLMIFVSIFAL